MVQLAPTNVGTTTCLCTTTRLCTTTSVPRRTRAGCGLCNGTAVHYHLCPCVHRAAPASCTVCDAACARFYAPHRLRRCAVACIPLLRSALPHAFSALRTASLPLILTRQTCSDYEIIMRYLTSSIVGAVCTPPPLPPPPLPLPSPLLLPSTIAIAAPAAECCAGTINHASSDSARAWASPKLPQE